MAENWLDRKPKDFTYGVNEVKSEIISSNSTAESAQAGARNLKVTIVDMLAKFKAALSGNRIANITAAQKTSLNAKEAVINALDSSCDDFIAACEAYKIGMQT